MKSDMVGMFSMPCPECGERIRFYGGDYRGSTIAVNCESNQHIGVEKFLQLWNGCTNPFCGWSKVKGVY